MENEIKEKLEPFLTTIVEKECEVVYILAEIRKLLEQTDEENNFMVLKFYCSWVLHAKMNSPRLLKEIEKEKEKRDEKMDAVMEEIVTLSKFREELKQFLSKQDLENEFKKDEYWNKFKNKLIKVISECPLVPNDSYNGPITEIRYRTNLEYKNINYRIEITSV